MRTRRHRAIEKAHWEMWRSNRRKLEGVIRRLNVGEKFIPLGKALELTAERARHLLRKGKL